MYLTYSAHLVRIKRSDWFFKWTLRVSEFFNHTIGTPWPVDQTVTKSQPLHNTEHRYTRTQRPCLQWNAH
jgi:hypothetical protein